MVKENNHVLIKVTPKFIEKNSMIEFNKYVFAYEVEIKNESAQRVWHLDVGSSHPGAGAGPKGMAVRHLKWYASWV